MDVRTRLKAHQFRFKKKFGQNFITDPTLLGKIARVAPLDEETVVLEIGAGAGTLTCALADLSKAVIAIEVDKALLPILEEVTVGRPVTLVEGDALKFDLDQLVYEKTGAKSYKIIANLPYYITTPLIMKVLEEAPHASEIVIMVQKEVAERLKAKSGSRTYGAISVMAQYQSEVKEAFFVSRKAFMPSPEVDSAVLHLKRHETKPYQAKDDKVFRKVVKASFGQRRKILRNALRTLGLADEILEVGFEKAGISPLARGESLSVEDFVRLADVLFEEGLR